MSALDIEISKLSVAERIQLVEDLWDAIATESPEAVNLSPESLAEVQRRLNDHDANPVAAVSWESVRAELFERTI